MPISPRLSRIQKTICTINPLYRLNQFVMIEKAQLSSTMALIDAPQRWWKGLRSNYRLSQVLQLLESLKEVLRQARTIRTYQTAPILSSATMIQLHNKKLETQLISNSNSSNSSTTSSRSKLFNTTLWVSSKMTTSLKTACETLSFKKSQLSIKISKDILAMSSLWKVQNTSEAMTLMKAPKWWSALTKSNMRARIISSKQAPIMTSRTSRAKTSPTTKKTRMTMRII